MGIDILFIGLCVWIDLLALRFIYQKIEVSLAIGDERSTAYIPVDSADSVRAMQNIFNIVFGKFELYGQKKRYILLHYYIVKLSVRTKLNNYFSHA